MSIRSKVPDLLLGLTTQFSEAESLTRPSCLQIAYSPRDIPIPHGRPDVGVAQELLLNIQRRFGLSQESGVLVVESVPADPVKACRFGCHLAPRVPR